MHQAYRSERASPDIQIRCSSLSPGYGTNGNAVLHTPLRIASKMLYTIRRAADIWRDLGARVTRDWFLSPLVYRVIPMFSTLRIPKYLGEHTYISIGI